MRGGHLNGKYSPARGGRSFRGNRNSGYYQEPYYSSSPRGGGRAGSYNVSSWPSRGGRGGGTTGGYHSSPVSYPHISSEPPSSAVNNNNLSHINNAGHNISHNNEINTSVESVGINEYNISGAMGENNGSFASNRSESYYNNHNSTTSNHIDNGYGRGGFGSSRFVSRGRGRGRGRGGLWNSSGGLGRESHYYQSGGNANNGYYHNEQNVGNESTISNTSYYGQHIYEGYNGSPNGGGYPNLSLKNNPSTNNTAVPTTNTAEVSNNNTNNIEDKAKIEEEERRRKEDEKVKQERRRQREIEFREKHWVGRIQAKGDIKNSLVKRFDELDEINSNLLDIDSRKFGLEIEINRLARILKAEEDRVRIAEEKLEALDLSLDV
ncbi:hypothetical protein DAPK24_015450 [Pichia kluyveri]|uniref:Transcription regulator LGE1 helical region domain-containing protein n=1 Tax=Pichia kluyveri TaxID=36015 RepID=A0AAV5R126_PICKL|nr:hypothetical protein DAPK24_015450 [Pichia kluyveri]